MNSIFKKFFCVILLTFMFISNAPIVNKVSASTKTFTLDVTYGQSEARAMLDLINDFRTDPEEAWAYNQNNEKVYIDNLQPLEYNYQLEKVAMQRAAEIAISYGHDRPNLQSLGSMIVVYVGYPTIGENIALGHQTKEEVFEAWQETDELYDDQGHRRNMLFPGFRYVGIGHAVVAGVHTWVQVFGSTEVGQLTPFPAANDSLTKVNVDVHSSFITGLKFQQSGSTPKMYVGVDEYMDIPSLDVYYDFKDCKIRDLGGANKVENPTVTYSLVDGGSGDHTIQIVGDQVYGLKNNPNKMNILNYRFTDETITDAGTEDGKLKLTSALYIYCVQKPEQVLFDEHYLEYQYGDTLGLSVKVYPEDTYSGYKGITYTSSNEDVVKRNNMGKLAIVGNGDAIITARSSYDPTLYDECHVHVYTPVTGVVISPSTNYDRNPIDVGETIKLTSTVKPNKAVNKNVVWESSKPEVATVDQNGNVTGVSVGKTTITVRTEEGNFTASKDISVSIHVKGIEVPIKNLTLYTGSSKNVKDLNIKVIPENATNKKVTYQSSNYSVLDVSYGATTNLIPRSVGEETITVVTEDGKYKDVINVTILQGVDKFEYDQWLIKLYEGQTKQNKLLIVPEDVDTSGITYSSSDESIVKVDQNGNITGVSEGTAIVYAYLEKGDRKTSCNVRVNKKVLIESMEFDDGGYTTGVDSSSYIYPDIYPYNASNQELKWTSSNEEIATVDQKGTVTGIKAGTCIITAETTDGSNLKASYKLEVKVLDTPNITFIRNVIEGVTFDFERVEDADRYFIYRKDNKDNKTFTYYASSFSNTFLDENVTAGVTYYYKVMATNYEYDSYMSDFKKICYLSPPELTSITNAAKGVKLTYTKVEGSSWYRVYRRANGESDWTKLGQTTKLTYTDTTAVSGVTYQYIVRSIRGSYYSGVINSLDNKICFLATPELKTVKKESNGIKLSYSKVDGATKYYIYRKDNKNNTSYTKIAETSSATYTDKNVTAGVTYTYLIKARRGSYTSYKSNAKKLAYK